MLLLTIGPALADSNIVMDHQKISSTEGNFRGPLDEYDWFANCAGLGDLNNDGVPDLAVGASSDGDGGPYRGAVWILFLNSDGTVNDSRKISDTEGGFDGELHNDDYFGWALEAIGDIDGDGVVDLAAGATGDDADGTLSFSGAVWILFLNADGSVKAHQKINAVEGNLPGQLSGGDQFGFSITALGDFDDDGVPDMAVGAPFDDDAGSNRGAFYILLLNADGTVKAFQKVSDTAGGFAGELSDEDTFGLAMNLGDLDGDGVIDLAVGAPEDDDGGLDPESNLGAVWILFMNPDGTVQSHQKISDTEGNFDGDLDEGDLLGEWLTGVGDLNDDGNPDVAVGALLDDDGGNGLDADRGALWILYLAPDGTVLYHEKISDTEGNFTGGLDDDDWFCVDPCPIGDLNGDGVTELAVGAPRDDDGGTDRGAVYILFLSPDIVAIDDPAPDDLPDGELALPARSRILASAPNPFNPSTTIHYLLARAGDASLAIYDLNGRLVRSFALGHQAAGEASITWDGTDDRGQGVPSGTYLLRLETAESSDAMRVTLVK